MSDIADSSYRQFGVGEKAVAVHGASLTLLDLF